MKKMVLFVFNDDPMCFIHVLLNALDMNEKGYTAKIIIEGSATRLIPELVKTENPLYQLWEKVKLEKLVEGVCKACSNKMNTLEAAKNQGLTLLDEMSGHPDMARYKDEGYDIVTF